jgi:asparagine synthase (glutamine-hydrolysing)
MCGLFGWIAPQAPDENQSRQSIDACFKSMHRRGPDDQGLLIHRKNVGWRADENLDGADIVLAHLRLSILDLSVRGRQPMASADGRYRMVYNGEVYNYKELRKELELEGMVFKTDTDTEVVLQALSHWGLSVITRFIGMFAIAFHDDQEKKTYLIRDFFGIKPLFYIKNESGMFGFASELPAILALPNVKRKVNPQRLYDYLLFGDYDSVSETMIEGVKHILPGHYMVVDSTTATIIEETRYWQPELGPIQQLSFSDSAEKLRELFLDNIRLHLRSDVSLGAALSGGVDSSAVAASIRYLEPDFDLKTFTYVASGSSLNEEKWADSVIQSIGAKSYKVSITANEMVSDLDDLIKVQGEPFGSTSIYAQYRVFKMTKDAGVTVTLDGQGADELLAGYIGLPGERLKSLLVKGRVCEAWLFFNATSKWPDRNKVMVFKRLISVFTPKSLYPLFWSIGQGSISPVWLNSKWFKEQGVQFDLPKVEELSNSSRYVHRALAKQLTQKGLPGLLRHGDRNSMRFSVESRVPFLTKEMAEFVLTLPEDYLIARDGTTKAVFKEAMRGIVPENILVRRDKIGFATPEKEWLQQLSSWVEETLAEADNMPAFHQQNLRQVWQEIMSGSRSFDWQVWRWLNFIRWAKLFDVEFS